MIAIIIAIGAVLDTILWTHLIRIAIRTIRAARS